MKAYLNWSGGKDAALALHYARRDSRFEVGALFTSVNAAYNRVSMHGVRRALLEQQAASVGLPLYTAELPEMPTMSDYERIMAMRVTDLKQQGYTASIFGDIFLDDLKRYREAQLSKLQVSCHFPLWQRSSMELVSEFIATGFKAIVVCVNGTLLAKDFCGRLIDHQFVKDLPPGIDPCGENGEYHSFVFDGPIFQQPLSFLVGEQTYREYTAPKSAADQCFSSAPQPPAGFYFQDLIPIDK